MSKLKNKVGMGKEGSCTKSTPYFGILFLETEAGAGAERWVLVLMLVLVLVLV